MSKELKSYDSYEISLQIPPDRSVTAIDICDIRLTRGQLVFEGQSGTTSAYHLQLCDNYEGQDLTLYVGGRAAIRAYPSPENPDQGVSGEFTLKVKTEENPDDGETIICRFPWGEPKFKKLSVGNTITQHVQPCYYPDVLIVGSGPLGATFARRILDNTPAASVMMAETGAQESVVVGEHKKNNAGYQKDIDSFVNVIKGALSILSIPVKEQLRCDAGAWGSSKFNAGQFVHLGQNPKQIPIENLSAAAATRVVGGMATHWTCATPEQHKEIERSNIFEDKEWDYLYPIARSYVKTRWDVFDKSIRHQLVLNTLKDAFEKSFPGRTIGALPLAAKRSENNHRFVVWAASDTIMENLTVRTPSDEALLEKTDKVLNLFPNHHCVRLYHAGGEIKYARLKDLTFKGRRPSVYAKKYILCGGAILNPQILYNSGFRTAVDPERKFPPPLILPALGKNLTEQPLAFCQVVLDEKLVAPLRPPRSGVEPSYPIWVDEDMKRRLEEHAWKHPKDPVPFPLGEQEPQVTTPVQQVKTSAGTTDYPWHTQIHRDAFSYGDVVPTIDSRLVVDLRWFARGGTQEPQPLKLAMESKEFLNANEVTFSDDIQDLYNMPQPTFNYRLTDDARTECHRMMEDMIHVSQMLGRYIPGSEPKFMDPGLTLHICGTTVAGFRPENSVVNKESRVWGVKNLWLGGNGVVPGYNASNPTLTSMCFAIWAVDNDIAPAPGKA